MKLYEIDAQIAELLENGIDPETGEVTVDAAALEALQLEREQKLENVGLAVKTLCAEAKAIREEEKALAERRRAKEAMSERLKSWLLFALDGGRLETARIKLAVRQGAPQASIDDEAFLPWAMESGHDELLRYKEPEIDRRAVLAMLKAGHRLPGCEIVRSASVVVK